MTRCTTTESGIGDYWVDMGVNASHYSGPHHVLFEGNWGDNLDNDDTHGNSMYITFFRNQGTGLRTPFTDPSLNKAVDDFTGVGLCMWTTGHRVRAKCARSFARCRANGV